MAGLTINVKRMEQEYQGEVVAQIIAFRQGRSIGFEVRSSNKLFKTHLEQILSGPYYSVMPGPQGQGYYANHVDYFHPGTVTFFTFLHDRLGWYGYLTELLNKQEVTKSIFFHEDEWDDEGTYSDVLTKSINWGQYSRRNKEGEMILVTVPPGYVAMSKGGKVVGPGKKVGRNGVNLDKPDATWFLVTDDGQEGEEIASSTDELKFISNDEWEKAYGEDPAAAKTNAQKKMLEAFGMSGKGDYHPGMHPSLYEAGSGVAQVPSLYQGDVQTLFESGISLHHILADSIAGTANDQELGGSDELPKHVLMMSSDEGAEAQMLVPGHLFAQYKHMSKNWVMFDASEQLAFTAEARAQARAAAQKKGEKFHPALIAGVMEKGKKIPSSFILKNFDLTAALPHDVKALFEGTMTSVIPTPEGATYLAEQKGAEEYVAEIFKASEEQLRLRGKDLQRTPKNLKKINALQQADRKLEAAYFVRDKKDGKLRPRNVNKRTATVKGLTSGQGKEDVYFDFLEDDGTPKGLMQHQLYSVEAMTNTGRYAAFGGPEESDGYFLQLKQGLGKSAIVLAADAVMRNKGAFKGTNLVVAPRAVVGNWASDLVNFRKKTENQDFFVIEGTRAQRQAKWDRIKELTDAGKPPQFVLVGAGKMAFEKRDDGPDEDGEEYTITGEEDAKDEVEFALDLQNIRSTLIETGNLSALTVDETGLFTNPHSKRHMALRALVNLATSKVNSEGKQKNTRSVVWTLNGNIMGNSATDAISELGWVNANVRLHRAELTEAFTTKVHKASDRRIFNPEGGKKPGLTKFMRNFGHSMNRMGYVKAVGQNNKHINEVTTPVGPEYGEVYHATVAKMESLQGTSVDKEHARFKLGMISMLVNASYNTAKPQRLMEYGLDGRLQASMKQILSKERYHEFMSQVQKYRMQTCQYVSENDVGWLPQAKATDKKDSTGLSAAERDKVFEATFSPEYLKLMNRIMNAGAEPVVFEGRTIKGWRNPLAEFVSSQVKTAMANAPLTSRLRMGFQSQSRMLSETVNAALAHSGSIARQLMTGGMKSADIKEMQRKHAAKKGSPILSIITGAGTYGVNFNSDVAFVTDHWNPARTQQGLSRFHRDVSRPVVIYSLVSSGVGGIVKAIAKQKSSWMEAAEDVDFSDEDAAEKVIAAVLGTELSSDSFLEKLKNNPIKIVGAG